MRFLVLVLLLTLSSSSQAQTACSSLYENGSKWTETFGDVEVLVNWQTLFGKHVMVRQVSRDKLSSGLLMADEIGGSEAIFVGLNAKAHIYLVANVKRYDGKLLFEEPGFQPRSDWLDKGLVLRIEDRNGELQDAIIDYFEKQSPPKAITCTAGACKVVNNATGINLATRMRDQLFPAKLIEHLVVNGVADKNGRPLKVEVFMIGNGSPEAVVRATEKHTARLTDPKIVVPVIKVTIQRLVKKLLSWFE